MAWSFNRIFEAIKNPYPLGAIKTFKSKNDHFEVKKVENHGVEEVNQLRKSIDKIKTLTQKKPQICTTSKKDLKKFRLNFICIMYNGSNTYLVKKVHELH